MLAELVGKLNRCLILEARVRPYSVVMLEPQTDHDLGLGAGTKPFEAQAQASNTKSTAHTWFGPIGVCGRGRELAIRLRGRRRGT